MSVANAKPNTSVRYLVRSPKSNFKATNSTSHHSGTHAAYSERVRAILIIFLGGGVGSVLRYLVSLGAVRLEQKLQLGGFPLGTFLVNIVGCFAIGFVMTAFAKDVLKDEHRLLLAVGLLGGFTTFSSFAWESVTHINRGDWTIPLMYVVLSNVLGIAAAFLAARLAAAMLA